MKEYLAGHQMCASVTSPMRPASTHSRKSRMVSYAWPWFMACVTRWGRLFAAASMASISWKLWTRGFSHCTCLPRARHSMAMVACQWSGTPTRTASMSFSCASSIFL